MYQGSLFHGGPSPDNQGGANRETNVRDQILDAFEEREGPWLEKIRAVAVFIARKKGRVSASDLRKLMVWYPQLKPENMNAMGSVFRTSQFRFLCWEASETPGRHANRIGVWEYVDNTDGSPPNSSHTPQQG